MRDIDESWWGMKPLNPKDGLSDRDGDGLSLAFEYVLGTHPAQADTDGDNVSDSDEVLLFATDPLDRFSFPHRMIPKRRADRAIPKAPTTGAKSQVSRSAFLPPPPSPSLGNGDFSNVNITTWKNASTSNNYQGGGFKWGEGATTAWTAYKGTTVEVWEAGGEKFGLFVVNA